MGGHYDARHRELARAGLAHSFEWCRTTRPDLSLYSGAGGVAIALAEVGRTIGDDELTDRANTVLDAASVPIRDDLIAGKAGAIVACLYAAELLDRSDLADTAADIGLALVASARHDTLGAGWRSGDTDEPALCGLAHGASGPAYALELLADRTGESAFAATANAATEYERAWFRREHGNWPDLRELSRTRLRSGDQPAFPAFWCHGAAGIGLVRMLRYRTHGRAIDEAEAATAMETCLRELTLAGRVVDASVCHGAAGTVELLLEGARAFGQPELHAVAVELADMILESGTDGHWPPGVPGGHQNPSLMLGDAGTGLVLLRAFSARTGPVGLLYDPAVTPSRVIVQLAGEFATVADVDRVTSELVDAVKGGKVERVSPRGRVVMRIASGTDIDDVVEALSRLESVKYAEADAIDHATESEDRATEA